jgi:hypothetical protein
MDGSGKINSNNVIFAISNIGIILKNEFFIQERVKYLDKCINNINIGI